MPDSLLLTLLRRWEEALARGEDPTPEQLCTEHPDRVEEFRCVLAGLFVVPPQSLQPTGPERPELRTESRPSVAGYEILGVLGRGGMAVVYQARQTRLKRLVALKVIRGSYADDPLIARFQIEAEAVARFQHPNIVQIHEVGEFLEGGLPTTDTPALPYCVLEYVGGGTLAQKLAGRPLPPSEAARIAETLARAVHYAHQHNVVHRDLKPANVLLTPEGEPKVADFGLAKNLDDDFAHTRTGQVMGTPSYMAPEQAEGRSQAIGPATDVWALGAILYEMLTGRPPFRGADVAHTLDLVRTHEPEPPSRSVAGTPRDLEIICLQCLRKEPDHRYRSALLLAQDLERFRGGELILARPEGLLRRLRRRLRHRGAVVGNVALAALVLTVAAFVALAVRGASNAAALRSEIEVLLDAAEWAPDHVATLEDRVERLAVLAPSQAEDARARLRQRFPEKVKAMLARPRLEQEDLDAIEANLQALAQRDASASVPLLQLFRDRQRSWELVVAFEPPFVLSEVRPPLVLRDNKLVARDLGRRSRFVGVQTTAVCRGNVQIEAEFPASWTSGEALALLLDADPEKARGYAFVLGAPGEGRPEGPRTTLANARLTGLVLEIRRDGVLQRQQNVAVSEGPLRMRASRVDNKLTVQVNDLPEVTFIDAFPLPMNGGRYGLVGPEKGTVERFDCRRQAVAPTPGPLDEADEHHAEGRYAEALALYQQQALAAGTGAAGAEARYKAGVCLWELNRPEEADVQLQRVAAEPGERWPPLAAFRLWVLRLERGRSAAAYEVFASLNARYRFEELIAFLPEALRARILRDYDPPANEASRLIITDEQLARMEKAEQVMAFLDRNLMASKSRLQTLIRAYESAGKIDKALSIPPPWLRKARQKPIQEQPFHVDEVMLQYVWLLRATGRLTAARTELDYWIGIARKVRGKLSDDILLGWLLERVRQDVAAENWTAAERSVQDCLTHMNERVPVPQYLEYSDAYLMLGFLRERTGDRKGARAAWKAGTEEAYVRRYSAPPTGSSGAARINNAIQATFTDQFDDVEAGRQYEAILEQFGATEPQMNAAKHVGVTPALLREMWQTPRGQDCARRLAFRTEGFGPYTQTPLVLLAYEALRRGAFAGELTADQDAFLWTFCGEIHAAYRSGAVGPQHIPSAVAIWRGIAYLPAWALLKLQLRPEVRGPFAYVLGQRLCRLGKAKEAETFFRTAHADAAPESLLRRLAPNGVSAPECKQ